MLSLRGSRKRKTEQIIQKFLRSYAENEKSQDKKDLKTWLVSELQSRRYRKDSHRTYIRNRNILY